MNIDFSSITDQDLERTYSYYKRMTSGDTIDALIKHIVMATFSEEILRRDKENKRLQLQPQIYSALENMRALLRAFNEDVYLHIYGDGSGSVYLYSSDTQIVGFDDPDDGASRISDYIMEYEND